MSRDELERNEEQLIANIIRVMRKQLERDYAPSATRRDAHPKHTGLLKAVFAVLPNLPPEVRVGLFAEPKSYEAWIRTSSASAKVRSDAIKDVRGFAIKLLDVGGDKIPESDEPRTQDFVLLSMPNMPLGTVKLFHDAIADRTCAHAQGTERGQDHAAVAARDPVLEHHALSIRD
jgi:hypothetical protein